MHMASSEYRVILGRLGLKPEDAARIPGITKRESFRWFRGKDPIPEAVARLLRALMRAGARQEELDEALKTVGA